MKNTSKKSEKDQTHKRDGGKIRLSLVPMIVLEKVLEVLEFGAEKYFENSWMEVKPTDRCWDSALRHLMSWKSGEILDKESGKPHLAHAICQIVFLLYFDLSGKRSK